MVHFLNEKSTNNELSSTKTEADNLNETQLKKIDEEVDLIRSKLNEIEGEHVKLDAVIEKAKGKKINEKIEVKYLFISVFCYSKFFCIL